jgi:hypothetical protein
MVRVSIMRAGLFEQKFTKADNAFLIIQDHIRPIPCPNPCWPTMKPKHFEREVRRVRHLSAWIRAEGRVLYECQVLDISQQGAKVVVQTPSAVPDRFELAFFQGGQSRVCEVIWRRSKMLGVRFIF